MNKIADVLHQTQMLYNKTLNQLSPIEDHSALGRLEIRKYKGRISYYQSFYDKQTKKRRRKYIPKSEVQKIRMMAQITYEEKLRRFLENGLKHTEILLHHYKEGDYDTIYQRLSPVRRQLVSPGYITTEKWMEAPNSGLPYLQEERKIITLNGEKVRSKSEKILADLFQSRGIVYKYECPLILKNGNVIYPDFTFFSPTLQVEIYWEHEGMMDDPAYVEKALKKIEKYEKNGIFRGVNLIVTHETSKQMLDIQWANILIDQFLVPIL